MLRGQRSAGQIRQRSPDGPNSAGPDLGDRQGSRIPCIYKYLWDRPGWAASWMRSSGHSARNDRRLEEKEFAQGCDRSRAHTTHIPFTAALNHRDPAVFHDLHRRPLNVRPVCAGYPSTTDTRHRGLRVCTNQNRCSASRPTRRAAGEEHGRRRENRDAPETVGCRRAPSPGPDCPPHPLARRFPESGGVTRRLPTENLYGCTARRKYRGSFRLVTISTRMDAFDCEVYRALVRQFVQQRRLALHQDRPDEVLARTLVVCHATARS